uniref:SUZ RNA-binding domain-containing n=1 Tax=Rhipicephalus pulchellus TaxID=72859 RepID=L7LV05_RHIPC
MVENGVLEKKLERLKVKTNSSNSNNANPPSSGGGSGVVGEVAVMPRVPDASRSGGSVNGTGSEKSPIRQPVKSLQQREAEYAEARLRILGSARSEDDGQKDKSSGVSVLNHVVTDPQQVPIRQPRGPDQGSNGFQQPRR